MNSENQQINVTNQLSNGLGIASLVLGILGFLTAFLIIGIFLDILAIVFGIISIVSKKQKSGLGIAGLIIAIVSIILMLLIGNIFTASTDNTTTITKSTADQTKPIDSNNTPIPTAIPLSSDQLDIQEYYFENTIGDTLHFLVIKNNSDTTIHVNSNTTALDSSGNLIGADTSELNALGSGNESCLIDYFSGVTGAASFDYTLSVKEDPYHESILDDLSYDVSKTDKKAIISLTNTGTEPARFVEAIALFFKDGELINYDSTYMTDDESELKPDSTITKELTCHNGYDEVKIYFTGNK